MEFEEQRAQFFQEYETRDDYMEGREGMDMVNTEFKVSFLWHSYKIPEYEKGKWIQLNFLTWILFFFFCKWKI